MKEVLLSGREIKKKFSDSGEPVLCGVNADILKGDFTIIMGSSGAGKSTLLYALSGMDRITGGQVIYKGQDIAKYSEKQMARLRSAEFGFVFQQTHLVSNLTIFENVAVAGYLSDPDGKAVRDQAISLLEQMEVSGVKDRLPHQVSGGEGQRAAIARAVISRPSLLFADEPTGALNKRNTEEVLDLLTSLNRGGQSILMVTHDLRAAIRGNRLLYLEDGKILDELTLPPFDRENAKEREAQVSTWLVGLNW